MMDYYTKQDQIEFDCRMVLVPAKCIVCDGKGVRVVPVSITHHQPDWKDEELVDCSNCHGEGEVMVERCNNCQQAEEECHCLDRVEEIAEAAMAATEHLAEVA